MDNRQRAINWMNKHPFVMNMFTRFALELAERNKNFGINLLRERVRWELFYEYEDEEYKFPNEYSPFIARRLAYQHPKLQQLMNFCKAGDEEPTCPIFISDEDMGVKGFERMPSDEPSVVAQHG